MKYLPWSKTCSQLWNHWNITWLSSGPNYKFCCFTTSDYLRCKRNKNLMDLFWKEKQDHLGFHHMLHMLSCCCECFGYRSFWDALSIQVTVLYLVNVIHRWLLSSIWWKCLHYKPKKKKWLYEFLLSFVLFFFSSVCLPKVLWQCHLCFQGPLVTEKQSCEMSLLVVCIFLRLVHIHQLYSTLIQPGTERH